METFIFTCDNGSVTYKGFTLGEALRQANDLLEPETCGEGVWMEHAFETGKYRWVLGNFYD